MKINYKYAIGVHVMFYEIEILKTYISGLINLLETVSNKENIYIDIAFNVSQFFEKIDTSKISKKQLIDRFKLEITSVINLPNFTYNIIDNDFEFYTQTNYRREFNNNYCNTVDYLIWGETDSLFPRESILSLERITSHVREKNLHRLIACFADRKMWDDTWDVTVHPNYVNHTYDEKDVDNINQAKSVMSIEDMNRINASQTEINVASINYPKIDGSCLVLSSDLIKSGVNIPPCFIHNDDESLSIMATKILGDKYTQLIFKNILKVHARRHPNKRMYVLGEENPRGFCGNEKGNWWLLFKQYSDHNINVLRTGTGKFYTHSDFLKNISK